MNFQAAVLWLMIGLVIGAVVIVAFNWQNILYASICDDEPPLKMGYVHLFE
jgi:hypothetical protein